MNREKIRKIIDEVSSEIAVEAEKLRPERSDGISGSYQSEACDDLDNFVRELCWKLLETAEAEGLSGCLLCQG